MNHKIELDKFHCKGCGACAEVAPNIFKMDDTGEKAEVLDSDASDLEAVELAAAMCPTNCIEIEKDED